MHDFVRKISFERQILKRVNSRYGKPQLNGVNRVSIAAWQAFDAPKRASTANKLNELAALLAFMMERSAERPGLGSEMSRSQLDDALASL